MDTGTPQNPLGSLDIENVLDLWYRGLGADVYVDMSDFLSSSPGRFFNVQSVADSLFWDSKNAVVGQTLQYKTNADAIKETGAHVAKSTHHYYLDILDGSVFSNNSFILGTSTGGFRGEMTILTLMAPL